MRCGRWVMLALALSWMVPQVEAGERKTVKAKVVKRKKSKTKAEPVSESDAVQKNASVEPKGQAGMARDLREGAFVCTNGVAERQIEVTYEGEGKTAPCTVHYRKVTEDPNHHQVLWTAQNDESYCDQKAQEFMAKLEGWGWSCQK